MQRHKRPRTFDIDVQQQLQVAGRHNLVFGAGFRASRGDDLGDGPGFFFDPQVRTSTIGNMFAQDEIALQPERLFLTLGSKVEHNDYTGFEFEPTARIRWSPDLQHTLWGAVSRAVRMPTRFDNDLRIVIPGTSILFLTGSSAFESENVNAYEAGYRIRPTERFSVDVATYANRYDDLRSQERPTTAGQPIVLGNGLNARTSGADLTGTFSLTSWWQTHASYSYLWELFTVDPTSRDTTGGSSEANDPAHLFSFRSYIDLPRHLQFDAFVRFTSRRPRPVVDACTGRTREWVGRSGPVGHSRSSARTCCIPGTRSSSAGRPSNSFSAASVFDRHGIS